MNPCSDRVNEMGYIGLIKSKIFTNQLPKFKPQEQRRKAPWLAPFSPCCWRRRSLSPVSEQVGGLGISWPSWLRGAGVLTVMCVKCATRTSMAVRWRACSGFDLAMFLIPLEPSQSRRRGSSWRTPPPLPPPPRTQLPRAMDRQWRRPLPRPRHLAVSGPHTDAFGFAIAWPLLIPRGGSTNPGSRVGWGRPQADMAPDQASTPRASLLLRRLSGDCGCFRAGHCQWQRLRRRAGRGPGIRAERRPGRCQCLCSGTPWRGGNPVGWGAWAAAVNTGPVLPWEA